MSAPYWLRPLREAVATLAEASAQAEAALPHAIKNELFALRRSRQIVSGWRHLSNAHPENVELQVLALVSEFCGQVHALEIERAAAGKTPNLSLGKMRNAS